jgi:isoleucyl-tRNA synthetase
MLSNLNEFSNPLDYELLNPVDKMMLTNYLNFVDEVSADYENFEFQKVYKNLISFSTRDLSSFYFDIIKDRLYNNSETSLDRRSAQTVLYFILNGFNKAIAPITPLLAEEVFEHCKTFQNMDHDSIFKTGWIQVGEEWKNETLNKDFVLLKDIRDKINFALEACRQKKIISSSNQSHVKLFVEKDSIAHKVLEKYGYLIIK